MPFLITAIIRNDTFRVQVGSAHLHWLRSHIKIPKLDSIPVLLCVESGLAKSRNYAIDPALVCQFWYLTKLEQIGNLNKIHREHVKTNLK